MLYLFLVGRKKGREKNKKRKEKCLGYFNSQDKTHLVGCASWDFHGC
jgi:hypothetical protein